MTYNKINSLTGWIICAVTCTVYVLTMEPTTSLWDTGEFISSSYKVQIPHPPGAPLFVLMGRLFIILFGDSPQTAAIAVNFMSALMSGLTILFLFWSITYFARRIIVKNSQTLTSKDIFLVMSAGVTGALAYAFSDSFWFSAVEGEVYSFSSFFTALVFWAILKWEQRADQPGGDRWLIFIFYMVGLSIGVHLLNLLTIPAIVLVYYFRRYKATKMGTLISLAIGCIITGFIQKFIIQYTVKQAGWFDIQFVNTFHLPFFSGFAVFFIILALAIVFGIRYAIRKKYYYLQLGLWSVVFILLGYSTYLTTMIRSNANPAVDMFNVDNPINLAGYLGREQYGDWPIVYGPDFTDAASYKADGDLYVKAREKYEVAGKNSKQDWANAPSSHFFPRMWDNSNDRLQIDCYRQFTGLVEGEAPSMKDNLKYFMNYQAGWMYMRYFMWNFAGKQNDLQGFGNVRDSNWISGVPFVDNVFYGDQSELPQSVHTDNKSYNKLFMLPFIVGLTGLFFQFSRARKDFLVNLLLFFFTGMAIVIYLNQAGFQPRERDYAYVGSFYVFAIWIGLGVIWINQQFQKIFKGHVATYAAALITFLAVPVWMVHEEWDDHDRSDKTLARDHARNYLESCPPNAILFTAEDNDTYPLWYAQEVEGIRPDVRVIVNTLSGSDWYMNQLRYKINESEPFNVIFTPSQIQGNRRQVMYYSNIPGFDQNKYYDLNTTLKNVFASDDPRFTAEGQDGETYYLFPVRKFSVPVERKNVLSNGVVHPDENILDELQIDISGKTYLLRSDLLLLSIIATSTWDRPVCFTSTSGLRELGLEKYVRREGLTYRLVPLLNNSNDVQVNNELAYKNIVDKFEYGKAAKGGIYYDEENRRRLNIIRLAHAELAISLVKAGEKEKASRVLEHFDKQINNDDFPYGMTSNRGNQHNAIASQFLQACYLSGDIVLAKKVAASIKRDLRQQMQYYNSLGEQNLNDEQLATNAYGLLRNEGGELSEKQITFAPDILSSYQLLRQLESWEKSL